MMRICRTRLISAYSAITFRWLGARLWTQAALLITLAGCALFPANGSNGVLVTLNGSDEVPPNPSKAKASGRIVVTKNHVISGTIVTKGLFVAMAHIMVGPPGKVGTVVIPLHENLNNTWSVPPGATLNNDMYQQYLKGNLYINLFSVIYPTGELRGQIEP